MKKLLSSMIVMMGLCVESDTFAAYLCHPFGNTVAGSASCTAERVTLTGVDFTCTPVSTYAESVGDVLVHVIPFCSQRTAIPSVGEVLAAGNVRAIGAGYDGLCFCHRTEPTVSNYVFAYQFSSHYQCINGCAQKCADLMERNVVFRGSLLQSVWMI